MRQSSPTLHESPSSIRSWVKTLNCLDPPHRNASGWGPGTVVQRAGFLVGKNPTLLVRGHLHCVIKGQSCSVLLQPLRCLCKVFIRVNVRVVLPRWLSLSSNERGRGLLDSDIYRHDVTCIHSTSSSIHCCDSAIRSNSPCIHHSNARYETS